MISIDIPDFGRLVLEHLVLDVNGTLAIDGELIDGLAQRMASLKSLVKIHLLTANTHGRQDEIDRVLGTKATIISGQREAEQKAEYVESLNAERVVAVGNGRNDSLMLKKAALGVLVIGQEGAAVEALQSADIIVQNPLDAFDLLLMPKRIKATLRR